MNRVRAITVSTSRALGAVVCAARGHRYYYHRGEVRSWCAYSCCRCGALDRPLDSLPFAPNDDDIWNEPEEQTEFDAEYRRFRRWVSWLPVPRWV